MQDPQVTGSSPAGDAYGPPPTLQQQPYPQQSYPPQDGSVQNTYPPQAGTVPADQGLSDTAAGTLAYVTIIPAIIFLIMAPYNTRTFVRFHAVQCLALGVLWFCLGLIAVIPILGWIVWLLGSLTLLVAWILCLVKASQGSYLKLPVISDFASKQSGYAIA